MSGDIDIFPDPRNPRREFAVLPPRHELKGADVVVTSGGAYAGEAVAADELRRKPRLIARPPIDEVLRDAALRFSADVNPGSADV